MSYPRVRLDSIAKVAIGATPARNKPEYWGGDNVWVSIAELDGGTISDSREHITDLGVQKSPSKRVSAGAILFSFKLSIGKMATAGVDLYTNEAIAAITVLDESRVFPRYLYHALGHLNAVPDAHTAVMGAMLNSAKVRALEIPLPPIDEQRRIAHLLDEADRLQRLKKEANEKGQGILPALFVEMFGDPWTNPMGWDLVPLGDLVESASNGTTATQNTEGKGYPVSRIETISSGRVDPTRTRYVVLDAEDARKWRLAVGDILFSHINSEHRIGTCAMYEGEPSDLIHGMNILLLRVRRSELLPEYLRVLLDMPSVRSHWAARTKRAVNQASINTSDVRSLPVPLPPLETQAVFANRYEVISALVRESDDSAQRLALIRNALADRAFAGIGETSA